MFDFKKYRESSKEQLRLSSILQILPPDSKTVLEIGSRDCFITKKLAERYDQITALDLTYPKIVHEKITPMQGDVTALALPNQSYDLVICTEVLEHIKPEKLQTACNEISRVGSKYLLIGVPYNQDKRVSATQCKNCGSINPTCGHVNQFDEEKLYSLFPAYIPQKTEFVGYGDRRTNKLTYSIYKLFHFPFGSYQQEEPCINCGEQLIKPKLNFFAFFICIGALVFESFQNKLLKKTTRPNWIHILFIKEQY
jgi:hypothetical protein